MIPAPTLEAISKIPVVPISAWVPCFKSSTSFKYACGLKHGPALNLDPNFIVEMASIAASRRQESMIWKFNRMTVGGTPNVRRALPFAYRGGTVKAIFFLKTIPHRLNARLVLCNLQRVESFYNWSLIGNRIHVGCLPDRMQRYTTHRLMGLDRFATGKNCYAMKRGAMMRTIFALLVAVGLMMTPLTALAGKGGGGKGGGGQGPSQKAYEKADDNAQFKRGGDAKGSEDQVQSKERHRHEETKGKAKGKDKGEKERQRSEGTQTD